MVLQMNAVGQMYMVTKMIADGDVLLIEMVATVTTSVVFDGNAMDGWPWS